MSENSKEQIVQSLSAAQKAEQDGYHFYLMAATSVADPKGKEVFETLAKEELDHLQFLRAQAESLQKTGKIDTQVQLGPRRDLDQTHPIYSEQIRGRLHEAHFEMSALSIGIQLEMSSQKYYREQAQAASDKEVQAFLLHLADWESSHYHALLKQQESLQQEYWQAGGFSPF